MAQADTDSDKWDNVSHVISSHYRVKVLLALNEQPGTPSSIGEETGLTVAHTSRALSELKDEGIVELLVSEDRKKGRVYGISELGEGLVDDVERMT